MKNNTSLVLLEIFLTRTQMHSGEQKGHPKYVNYTLGMSKKCRNSTVLLVQSGDLLNIDSTTGSIWDKWGFKLLKFVSY